MIVDEIIKRRGRLARALHYENGAVAGSKKELIEALHKANPSNTFEGHTSRELLIIADEYVRANNGN